MSFIPAVGNVETLPTSLSCDVAIVGYGPVGMIMSILLAQRGLSVVVVERFKERYKLPRAGHFDSETMRTFQQLGIAEDVELIARPMLEWHLVNAERKVLAEIKLGVGGGGWKESYLTYQPEFEAVFDARAKALGVRIFMGVNAISVEQDAHGTQLRVQATDEPDSVPAVINSAFIIGADGANSFVRGAIGVERRNLGFQANDQLVIDFEHNDPDRDLPQLPEVYQVLDINRPQLAGRWSGTRWSRFEFQAVKGESREYFEKEETCWALLSTWGIYPGDGKIIRHSVYRFESYLAEKWRIGRVFLVGDAAHTMPPFMGQGLCSGIRDAFNLAWKLVAFHAGEAKESLLDTYESERAPHVRAVIDMSIAVGNLVLMTDPEQARQRDQALQSGKGPEAPQFPRLGDGIVRASTSPATHPTDGRPSIQGRAALGRRVDRLDQFLKPGWKIISRHPISDTLLTDRQRDLMSALDIQVAHVSRGANAQYADIDGDYDAWYRKTGRKAFLLRPDHYVFGSVAVIEDLPALLDDLQQALSSNGWRGGARQNEGLVSSLELVRPW